MSVNLRSSNDIAEIKGDSASAPSGGKHTIVPSDRKRQLSSMAEMYAETSHLRSVDLARRRLNESSPLLRRLRGLDRKNNKVAAARSVARPIMDPDPLDMGGAIRRGMQVPVGDRDHQTNVVLENWRLQRTRISTETQAKARGIRRKFQQKGSGGMEGGSPSGLRAAVTVAAVQSCATCHDGTGLACGSAAPARTTVFGSLDNATYNMATVCPANRFNCNGSY